MSENVDRATAEDFGREWRRFDQSAVPPEQLTQIFDSYFRIFPWHTLPAGAKGFDAGCGSGRWAAIITPRVGHLFCIDASTEAVAVARRNVTGNVSFHECSLNAMPVPDNSMDFGYSLGVLHHLPDPEGGLAACVRKLKPGAPMLVYIYYAFDNRPVWFRLLWRVSDLMRRSVSRAPFWLKAAFADLFALLVYWPLARTARTFARMGRNVDGFPLSNYRERSFYVMRNDALDRFGTRLEHRMTRAQIAAMMERAGLRDINFSETAPYWCAVGRKA